MPTNPDKLKKLVERTKYRVANNLIPDRPHLKDKSIKPPSVRIKLEILPCTYRGAILEYCTTCNGEAKHVRSCEHPENESEKCTLAVVSDKVWSCSTCTHREVETDDRT